MIGDDCQIKPGAQIINSVLGQGCFVEERARVENSVIWPHTRVGHGRILFGSGSSGAVVISGAQPWLDPAQFWETKLRSLITRSQEAASREAIQSSELEVLSSEY